MFSHPCVVLERVEDLCMEAVDEQKPSSQLEALLKTIFKLLGCLFLAALGVWLSVEGIEQGGFPRSGNAISQERDGGEGAELRRQSSPAPSLSPCP